MVVPEAAAEGAGALGEAAAVAWEVAAGVVVAESLLEQAATKMPPAHSATVGRMRSLRSRGVSMTVLRKRSSAPGGGRLCAGLNHGWSGWCAMPGADTSSYDLATAGDQRERLQTHGNRGDKPDSGAATAGLL